jgi:hypothetical protein
LILNLERWPDRPSDRGCHEHRLPSVDIMGAASLQKSASADVNAHQSGPGLRVGLGASRLKFGFIKVTIE